MATKGIQTITLQISNAQIRKLDRIVAKKAKEGSPVPRAELIRQAIAEYVESMDDRYKDLGP